MKLRRTSDNQNLEAKIIKLIETEFDRLKGSSKFKFDWSIEKYSDVFKIVLLSDLDEILGLIMITDESKSKRIHIELIESTIDNQGFNKKYDNIAGCLIAFAVLLSFDKGYQGFVSLDPKTQLIGLYRDKYGFSELGYMMITEMPNSQLLIDKYLDDE